MTLPVLNTPFFFLPLLLSTFPVVQGASWCVARSDASYKALQTALDYACASGADCTPLQSDGLCFLPNTIQAHASYAFNSYYQRRAMTPGSCDFAGTATVAKTDPSYGSCMYPSSQSTAGGITTPTTTSPTVTNNPNPPTTTTNSPLASGDGNTGLNNPGLTPPFPTTDDSRASFECIVDTSLTSVLLLLILSLILHPIWIF
ncbi:PLASMODESMATA CALLOSE-BINDING PROTEIN 3-like [Hibiscus syriacus]|uniref:PLASMODESMATA CALLOSE-BINDING PROTEIN 3-like n=1 Tax=Hibiscus syriacus TaxID=106335 RepID=UPI0019215AEA|nr:PLASMODESMATA CALLOSE-BINDING PROTEIN 3-like [Hibiscus syriacus]